MAKIVDLIHFEDWVLSQPVESSELLGSRLILRLLPFWKDFHYNKPEFRPDRTMPFWRLGFVDWVYFASQKDNGKIANFRREAKEAYKKAFPSTAYSRYTSVRGQEKKAEELSKVCKTLIRNTRAVISSDDAEEEIWASIGRDASIIEQTKGLEFCATRPLWPISIPAWSEEQWSRFRAEFFAPDLLDENDHWTVWTKWYEGRLRGDKFDLELEIRKASLPDAAWKRPAREINLGLLRTIEIRSEEIEAQKDQLTLFTLLETKEIRSALADFHFNELKSLMEMVPFEDDHGGVIDEKEKRRRKDDLSDLGRSFQELVNDIKEEGKNVPKSMLNTLQRYATECSRDIDDVRPGRLWDLGALLHNARLDEDIKYSLGNFLFAGYEQALDKHFDLMRDYFAATISRQRNVDEIAQAEDARPEDLLDTLSNASEALKDDNWGTLPSPAQEIPAVIDDQIEELEGLLQAAKFGENDETRQRYLQTFWRKGKTAAVTLLRFAVRTGAAVGFSISSAAGLQQLFPTRFGGALEKILSLFTNIPWLH